MDGCFESCDRLFELLAELNNCIESDRGEEALEVIRTIKKEGKALKRDIEDKTTEIKKKAESKEAALKLLEDKYTMLEDKKQAASRQLDDYQIARVVSGVAIANFCRDEQKDQANLEQARHELQLADEEVKRLQVRAKSVFAQTATRFKLMSAQSRFTSAYDKVRQAENQLKATKDAKAKQEKVGGEAEERYADAKKAYKECKGQKKTIWHELGKLKVAVVFASRACTELQIVLGLTEDACSSTKELKKALNREFSKKAIGEDEDPTYLPIPVSRVTKGRFSATKEHWQYIAKEIS